MCALVVSASSTIYMYSSCILFAYEELSSYEMLSVEKLMIVAIKLSLRRTLRMAFQSVAGSPMRRQMDSIAIFTIFGGLASDLISTRCCLLIDFTAEGEIERGNGT